MIDNIKNMDYIIDMEMSIAIGMVFKLMRGERVTARDLADEFEISIRTVYRYIDKISAGGVPLITLNGKNGGVEIDSRYKVDSNFLTLDEVKHLLNLLKNEKKDAKNQILTEKINKIYQI